MRGIDLALEWLRILENYFLGKTVSVTWRTLSPETIIVREVRLAFGRSAALFELVGDEEVVVNVYSDSVINIS